MNELALFAGAGGGILGGHLLGWRTICAVEWMPCPRSVLMQRQDDGILRPFPIWGDVQTFDGKPWAGLVDVVSGGFPCQDISAAGKGAGIDGQRSGMWSHMARIIGEVRPRFAFVENSPMLTTRGLGRVLGDLAALGYDAEWGVLGADDVEAPHIRKRIWILANADRRRRDREKIREVELQGGAKIVGASNSLAHPDSARLEVWNGSERATPPFASAVVCDWWDAEPDVGRVAHGVANRVDRLRAIGNGQVPAVAAIAFRILADRLGLAT